MLNLLKDYEKPVKVNGKVYPDGKVAYAAHCKTEGVVEVELNFEATQPKPEPKKQPLQKQQQVNKPEDVTEYRIKVRAYMTKNSPGFDFHQKWNNNIPMPLRVMAGTIVDETKGMYKMKLHGKPEPTSTCMKCGRKLTHPVSMNYGIGPECGGHHHIGMEMDIEEAKKRMQDITWEGWVIKKAIQEKEVVKPELVREVV